MSIAALTNGEEGDTGVDHDESQPTFEPLRVGYERGEVRTQNPMDPTNPLIFQRAPSRSTMRVLCDFPTCER